MIYGTTIVICSCCYCSQHPEIRHASNTCTPQRLDYDTLQAVLLFGSRPPRFSKKLPALHSFMEPFNVYMKSWKHETLQQANKKRNPINQHMEALYMDVVVDPFSVISGRTSRHCNAPESKLGSATDKPGFARRMLSRVISHPTSRAGTVVEDSGWVASGLEDVDMLRMVRSQCEASLPPHPSEWSRLEI